MIGEVFTGENPERVSHTPDQFPVEVVDRIRKGRRGNVINVYAHSDFGRAFRMFHREHLAAITRHTTVIILGDARTNGREPHADVFALIQDLLGFQ